MKKAILTVKARPKWYLGISFPIGALKLLKWRTGVTAMTPNIALAALQQKAENSEQPFL
jgi:hypothetical protein